MPKGSGTVNLKFTYNLSFPHNGREPAHTWLLAGGMFAMSYKLSAQKLVSMTVAALTGAVMCGLFALILMATGALAG